MTEALASALLTVLGDWSIRWGLVLLPLAAWFLVRPPGSAALRYMACLLALTVGALLPLTPRWRGLATGRAGVPMTADTRPTTSDEHATRSFRMSAEAKPGEETSTARSTEGRPAESPRAPTPPSLDLTWRLVVSGLALAWTLGMVGGLVRRLAGLAVLRRLKAEATEAQEGSQALLQSARSALGLRRPVRLATHPAIGSPLTIGGWRACLLVPVGWESWPEPHRRACLIHELSHLARRDDWVKLVQDMVRLPLFFHPLVAWLMARLDRERELLCDERVISHGADPVEYARLLLDLAQRPGRLLSATTLVHPGGLGFLDRRTAAVRIQRLLEDDMLNSLAPPLSRRRWALGAMALIVTLGASSWRVWASEPKIEAPLSVAWALKAQPDTGQDVRALHARVQHPDGSPVVNALVVAVDRGTEGLPPRILRTNDEGRFTWPLRQGPYAVSVVVHKEGLVPYVWGTWLDAEEDGGDHKWTLREGTSFASVLVNEEGKPLAGARVQIEMIAGQRTFEGGPQPMSTMTTYSYVWPESLEGTPALSLFETTTDEAGVVRFDALYPGTLLKLRAIMPDGRILRVDPAVAADGRSVRGHDPVAGFVPTTGDVPARLLASPTARVTGRLVTQVPGLEVAGRQITFQSTMASQGNMAATVRQTDTEGRFVLEGLDPGAINIFVNGPGENETWTYRAAADVPLKAGETSEVTIELVPGVIVEGRVLVQGSDHPAVGVVVGIAGPNRPRSGAGVGSASTDEHGQYRLRLPSGETTSTWRVLVRATYGRQTGPRIAP